MGKSVDTSTRKALSEKGLIFQGATFKRKKKKIVELDEEVSSLKF